MPGLARIRAHKTDKSGVRWFECEWVAKQQNGAAYEPEWIKEEDLFADELKANYMSRISARERMGNLSIELWPLLDHMRRSIYHAITLAKSRCRPKKHELQVECLVLEQMAFLFLEICTMPKFLKHIHRNTSKLPSAYALPITKTKETDGSTTWSLAYTTIENIASFASFHSLEPPGQQKCIGCLRHDIGRASNEDMMVMAPPLLFKATQTKRSAPRGAQF